MAIRTTTQNGPISLASTFGGTAFSNGDKLVVAHQLTIDTPATVGDSPIGPNLTLPVLAATTGGSLGVASYAIRYTQVDAAGNESELSPYVLLATTATNNRIAVILPALAVGVVSYNIYALNTGQIYFRQIVGAVGGVTNFDSYSNATAYVPTHAIRVLNPNGRLIVNADITIKGSMGLDGTTTATDVILLQAAGTSVVFDNSTSPNPTFGYQITCGGYTNGRKCIYWKTNGTALSRCSISAILSTYATYSTTQSMAGVLDFSYTDIARFGTSAIDAFAVAADNTVATFNLTNCVFDSCGRTILMNSLQVGFNVVVTNTTWKNSAGFWSFYMTGSLASPTGLRVWKGNVVDKNVRFGIAGLTIGGTAAADECFFMAFPNGSGTGDRLPNVTFNTFFRATDNSAHRRLGDWDECVMIVDASTLNGVGGYSAKADMSNPHWVSTGNSLGGQYNIFRTIFESFGADDQGDVDYGGTTGQSRLEYCIGVPEDVDSGFIKGVGTLSTLNGFAATYNSYNHNTWYLGAQGLIALAEGGNGFGAMCNELQSNIAWNSNRGAEGSTTFNRLTYEPVRAGSLSGTSMTPNTVNASRCGHNCRFNLFTGSGTDPLLGAYTDGGILGHSYHHYATYGTFGATDVTGDPQFVDPSVRFWTWVKSFEGSTLPGNATPDRKDYQAWGLYKLCLKNEPAHADYDARYTLAAYKAFIRAGFTPQNAALIGTAHDGTTIGAVQV